MHSAMTAKMTATKLVNLAMLMAGMTSLDQVPNLDVVLDFAMDHANHGGQSFHDAAATLVNFLTKKGAN